MFDSTKGTVKEGRCSEVPLDCFLFWNWKQKLLAVSFWGSFFGTLGKKKSRMCYNLSEDSEVFDGFWGSSCEFRMPNSLIAFGCIPSHFLPKEIGFRFRIASAACVSCKVYAVPPPAD